MNLRKIFFILAFGLSGFVSAQDPHFTQFYSAPLSVNPAYTGVFEGKARVMSNYRQQWASAIDPFTTALVSADIKVVDGKTETQNPFNIGFQVMNDKSMKGAFKSNFLTLTASSHVPMDQEGYSSLGAGLTATYGDRRIDFMNKSFDEQFVSGGFDLNLPTGESALGQLESFVSVGAGLLYRYDNHETGDFFDIGLSAYNVNRPRQSVLADKNQFVPVRYSAQASYQKYLNESTLINIRGLYQHQAMVEYFLAGFSYAKLIGQNKEMVGAGLWYRTGDALSPYLFLELNKMMIGFSYDITLSDFTKGPKPARSIELSLQWRLSK
jgi:type IX secretion system PorP/SprF family membrane protein